MNIFVAPVKDQFFFHRYVFFTLKYTNRFSIFCLLYFQLLKCLVSGLFTNCAWLRGGAGVPGGSGGAGGRYVTAGGAAAALHPGGALLTVRPPPPAVLYTELLSTSRCYLVTVSAVQPHWLHQLAPDYARRCRATR